LNIFCGSYIILDCKKRKAGKRRTKKKAMMREYKYPNKQNTKIKESIFWEDKK
jgi:hypothetical protein